MGYSPWSRKEQDTTERLTLSLCSIFALKSSAALKMLPGRLMGWCRFLWHVARRGTSLGVSVD